MGHQASICIDMADAGKLGAASPLLTVLLAVRVEYTQRLPAELASVRPQQVTTPQLALTA
jgi:hypothetical protein